MTDFIEVIRRFEAGEKMGEQDFDLKQVSGNARRLAKEMEIQWERGALLETGTEMADRLFEAGLSMAEETGIYCTSTGSIARFSREELLEGIRHAPSILTIGAGRDARTLRARKPGDGSYPIVFAGNAGAPMPEELFLPTALSYMKEPLVDAMDHSAITTVDGVEVRTGSPLEVRATRRELEYLKTAAQRAGRPGMPFICAESSGTALGDLGVTHPRFMKPGDIHLCPLLSEMKTDFHNLTKTANMIELPEYLNGSLPNPIVGGYAGGPAETAIVTVASFILANLVCGAHLHLCHPVHVRFTSTTHAQCLWLMGLVGQAFARNTHMILVGDIFASNGAGTRSLLYETATNAIVNSVSGMHLNGVAATNGLYPNSSGLEARLMARVGRAVTDSRLTPESALPLVKALYEKYEHTLKEPETGLPFPEVYHMDSITPKDQWLSLYQEVSGEIGDLGLELKW